MITSNRPAINPWARVALQRQRRDANSSLGHRPGIVNGIERSAEGATQIKTTLARAFRAFRFLLHVNLGGLPQAKVVSRLWRLIKTEPRANRDNLKADRAGEVVAHEPQRQLANTR